MSSSWNEQNMQASYLVDGIHSAGGLGGVGGSGNRQRVVGDARSEFTTLVDAQGADLRRGAELGCTVMA
jgi:hypothetical protein